MSTKKFYCHYVADDRIPNQPHRQDWPVETVIARKTELLEVLKTRGWKDRVIQWMDAVHFVSIGVPDNRVELIEVTAPDGPLMRAGFRFWWEKVFGERRPISERTLCASCKRVQGDSVEEEDLVYQHELTGRSRECPVANAYWCYENNKYGAVFPYWENDARMFMRRKNESTPFSVKEAYCQDCIKDEIVAGLLVAVADCCRGCGDYQPPIKCALCATGHSCVSPDHTATSKQGSGCCAHTFERKGTWYLSCGYGSGFDMDIYEVMDTKLQMNVDPICDECLKQFIDSKKIVKVSDNAMQWSAENRIDVARDDSQPMTMQEFSTKHPDDFSAMLKDIQYSHRGYHEDPNQD